MLQDNPIYQAFIAAWPLSRLRDMSLDEYCSVGNDNAFTYWLEFKTNELGGIGGGSAYKFGVFKRKAPKDEPSDSPYATDGVYAWVKYYGNSAQAAFATVKAGLVAAAEAAGRGDLGALEAVDLPKMLKWKTGFLYQDPQNPCLLPIYYDTALRFLAFGDPAAKRSIGEAQIAMIQRMPKGANLLEYGSSEWARWAEFEGSVAGLIASDGLSWKDEVIVKLREKKEAVIWWSKRPSGKELVRAQLKKLVANGGSFPFYFTRSGAVTHRARVIDVSFASEYETKKARWVDAVDYEESWEDYSDGDKSAAVAFLINEMTRLETPLKAVDFEYWGGYSSPTQDNLQPFVSVSGDLEDDTSVGDTKAPTLILPSKNVIYYGPPGTGKTFFLRDQLFLRFTKATAGKSREAWLTEEADRMSWWKVVAAALLAGGAAQVPAIAEHEFVRAKITTTKQASPRAMIWSMLQQHTFDDCETVKYTRRADPQLFRKDVGSIWSVDPQAVKEAVPEVEDFVAKARNYSATGQGVEKNYSFITFHQSMSYEDFIEGIKPMLGEEIDEQGLAYELKEGVFKELCARARRNPGADYAILIDEINRGNVSGIFGELISLIEEDKRAGAVNTLSARLPYSREEFSVPSNVYVIGTMNSADRSVEALDTALRRRFSFVEMPPRPELLSSIEGVDLSKLLETVSLRLEALRDRDHRIGHAYLMGIGSLEALHSAFSDRIIPLLQEYFYGDWEKIAMVLGPRFVSKRESKVTWPKQFADNGETVSTELWAFTDQASWDAEAFKSIYG